MLDRRWGLPKHADLEPSAAQAPVEHVRGRHASSGKGRETQSLDACNRRVPALWPACVKCCWARIAVLCCTALHRAVVRSAGAGAET